MRKEAIFVSTVFLITLVVGFMVDVVWPILRWLILHHQGS
jgi:hypothetical protein